MSNLIESITSLISPILKSSNVVLYSIKYENKNLEILLDSESGVDLDKCVEVSELISSLLDKNDLIKEDYVLEVASAGAERPLETEEQFIKAIDQYIQVHTTKLYEGYDELVGYLREYNKDYIVLEIKIKTRTINCKISSEDIIDCMTTVKV